MIRKTAIIIGASSDIGLATAKKFAKKGYNLALTYNKNKINFEEEINCDIDIKTYELDLTKSEKISEVFSAISSDCKSIDCLVFCAGISQKRKLIFDVNNDEIDNLFDINIVSAIKCTKEFVSLAISKENASIVLVGSFVERNGCSCESVYTASKSAMYGLCKSLSSELGNFGIRVNIVAPGFIDTKMNNNLSKAEKEDIENMTPLQRLGTADDIASAIYFLSSDDASFITGQTLYVDGGLILQ